jgi:MraZ protein
LDKKGRVSVPAPFRLALSAGNLPGVAVFPTIFQPAITAFGRDTLEEMSRRRHARTLEDGQFERALIGTPEPDALHTIFGLIAELSFDPEGRITLPTDLRAQVGITDEAVFVGRGTHFEIWSPGNLAAATARELERIRTGAANGGGVLP